jgi:hypothetical protein
MGVRLYKHRHGIHITVGNVMLDVIYVAVVDFTQTFFKHQTNKQTIKLSINK